MAACATVALWCLLFKKNRGLCSNSAVPTPATNYPCSESGLQMTVVPSRRNGLRIAQICNAIKYVWAGARGDPCRQETTARIVNCTDICAFGIPVVMVVEIKNQGLHAVTMTGYSLRGSPQGPQEAVRPKRRYLPMVGRRIDEFLLRP